MKKVISGLLIGFLGLSFFAVTAFAQGTPQFTFVRARDGEGGVPQVHAGDTLLLDFDLGNMDPIREIELKMDTMGLEKDDVKPMPVEWGAFLPSNLFKIKAADDKRVQFAFIPPEDAEVGKYGIVLRTKLVNFDGKSAAASGVSLSVAIGSEVYVDVLPYDPSIKDSKKALSIEIYYVFGGILVLFALFFFVNYRRRAGVKK